MITEQDETFLANLIAKLITDEITPLKTRIAELEARPASAGVKYAGVWKEETGIYAEGSLTTYAGGLWLAQKTTHRKPGQTSSDWVLVVKRGAFDDSSPRFATDARTRHTNAS